MAGAVDVPGTYYVGLKPGSDLDRERYPLAFATPGGTDAAALKRKQTVDEWARAYRATRVGEPGSWTEGPRYEMQNDWLTGFQFASITSRNRTDNKVYDIQDPRGFTLQIYSDNMEQLLLETDLRKGEILNECCWARDSGKMWLLAKGSTAHQEWEELRALKEAQRGTGFVPGDIISQDGDVSNREVFLGNVYQATINFVDVDRKRYDWSYSNRSHHVRHRMTVKFDEKPWKASVLAKDSNRPYVYTKRQLAKKTVKLGHDDDLLASKISEIAFGGPDPEWKGTYGGCTMYFRTLAEMRAWRAENGPSFQWFRDRWIAAHPASATRTYELLEDTLILPISRK